MKNFEIEGAKNWCRCGREIGVFNGDMCFKCFIKDTLKLWLTAFIVVMIFVAVSSCEREPELVPTPTAYAEETEQDPFDEPLTPEEMPK